MEKGLAKKNLQYEKFNDIHKLNTQTYTWDKCAPTGTRPSPRCGCVCWYTGDRVVVFGGVGDRPTNVKDNEQIVQHKRDTSYYYNNQVFHITVGEHTQWHHATCTMGLEPTQASYPSYGKRRPYQLSSSGLALSFILAIIFCIFHLWR